MWKSFGYRHINVYKKVLELHGCYDFFFPPRHYFSFYVCKMNKNKLIFKVVETETDWGKLKYHQGHRNNNTISGNSRITAGTEIIQ